MDLGKEHGRQSLGLQELVNSRAVAGFNQTGVRDDQNGLTTEFPSQFAESIDRIEAKNQPRAGVIFKGPEGNRFMGYRMGTHRFTF
jgi:hypothetical protein